MESLSRIFDVLKGTALFLVAARIILLIFPGKKYDKYGKMVVALVVLSQLAVPILSFGNEDLAGFFTETADVLEAQNEMFSTKMEGISQEQDDLVEDGLVLSVEERIAGQAQQAGVKVTDVRVGDGSIIIEVKANAAEENSVAVDPVKIKTIELGGDTGEDVAARADAGARKGKRREDLEGLFAGALGMGEKEVEVIELQ